MLGLIECTEAKADLDDETAHILPISPEERSRAYYSSTLVRAVCGALVEVKLGVVRQVCIECTYLWEGKVIS